MTCASAVLSHVIPYKLSYDGISIKLQLPVSLVSYSNQSAKLIIVVSTESTKYGSGEICIKKKEAVKRDLEEIHCTAEMSLWSFLQCLPWRDRSKKLITEVHIGSTKHASEEIQIKKKEPMKRPCRKPLHFRNELVVFLWKIHQEKVWKTL